MSTRETYKNVPAMKRKDQVAKLSMLPIKRPMSTPKKHRILDTILKKSARLNESPLFRKTAKSPISCGSSWKNTAIVVPKPVVSEAANEAPIAKPSLKLCSASPITIMNIDDL